jgi:hypothetical protein
LEWEPLPENSRDPVKAAKLAEYYVLGKDWDSKISSDDEEEADVYVEADSDLATLNHCFRCRTGLLADISTNN